MQFDKKLVMESGQVFRGQGFGARGTCIAELVYNTSMVGYQEILSDPAYKGEALVMSYPLIGNYGLTDEDYESKGVYLSGMIVREYNDMPSNYRFTRTLGDVMEDNGVCGIQGVDTREIVRILRDNGTMLAVIADEDTDTDECLRMMREYVRPTRQVAEVSTRKAWYSRTRNETYNVVAIDCGLKHSMLKALNKYGCNVIIVPFDTTAEQILRYKPDGVLVAGGPGNPTDVVETIAAVQALVGKLPIMGIGLGCQIIALSYGGKVEKMRAGHRGANQPVRNVQTGAVQITEQNHAYSIVADSLACTGLCVTEVSLIDGDVESIRDEAKHVLGAEYCPECGDGENMFTAFVDYLKEEGGRKNAQENRY